MTDKDIAEAMERFDNDTEIYITLIDAFLSPKLSDIEETKKSLVHKKYNQVLYHAHKIKGAALTLGANELARAAARLEAAMRNSDTESAELLYNELESLFTKTVTELAELRDRLQKAT